MPDSISQAAPPAAPTPADPNKTAPEPAASSIQKTTYDASREPLAVPPNEQEIIRVRARVNEKAILDEEVRAASLVALLELHPEERAARQKEIYSRVLDRIIDRELLIQDLMEKFAKFKPLYVAKLKEMAKTECDKHFRKWKTDMKLQSDDDFKKILPPGVTLEGYRRQREREYISMEYIKAMLYPQIVAEAGHRQIVEYYEQHASEFETVDSVDWQDIFIDVTTAGGREKAGQLAQQIADRAKKGENFVQLVSRYDNGDSHYHPEGSSGLRRRGEIQPAELEPVLFQMRDGEIGPVVEVAAGFHVVRLVKREHTGKKPLDAKVQAEIKTRLQNEIFQRESRRIVLELRRKAAIEIMGDTPEQKIEEGR